MFTFLPEVTEKIDTLDIIEGKTIIYLSYILKSTSKEQYNSVRSVTNREDGGVGCFSEAGNHFIQTCVK